MSGKRGGVKHALKSLISEVEGRINSSQQQFKTGVLADFREALARAEDDSERVRIAYHWRNVLRGDVYGDSTFRW